MEGLTSNFIDKIDSNLIIDTKEKETSFKFRIPTLSEVLDGSEIYEEDTIG